MYDLSLAIIGSVIFYYIVEFYSRDKIQEKYEKMLYEYLKYINYSMKEMIYILDDKPSDGSGEKREDIKNVVNRIFQKKTNKGKQSKNMVPCRVRTRPDESSSERLDKIYEEQKSIENNVETIIKNFARFMSDNDLDLLNGAKFKNIGSNIWIAKQCNSNHMVKRKEAEDYVKIQKEIEKRIEEIKRQNND